MLKITQPVIIIATALSLSACLSLTDSDSSNSEATTLNPIEKEHAAKVRKVASSPDIQKLLEFSDDLIQITEDTGSSPDCRTLKEQSIVESQGTVGRQGDAQFTQTISPDVEGRFEYCDDTGVFFMSINSQSEEQTAGVTHQGNIDFEYSAEGSTQLVKIEGLLTDNHEISQRTIISGTISAPKSLEWRWEFYVDMEFYDGEYTCKTNMISNLTDDVTCDLKNRNGDILIPEMLLN